MNDFKMQEENQSQSSTQNCQAQLYLLCNKITGLEGGETAKKSYLLIKSLYFNRNYSDRGISRSIDYPFQ